MMGKGMESGNWAATKDAETWVDSSRLEGIRRWDHFCLALAETLHGLTPVTHPGDSAHKNLANRKVSKTCVRKITRYSHLLCG